MQKHSTLPGSHQWATFHWQGVSAVCFNVLQKQSCARLVYNHAGKDLQKSNSIPKRILRRKYGMFWTEAHKSLFSAFVLTGHSILHTKISLLDMETTTQLVKTVVSDSNCWTVCLNHKMGYGVSQIRVFTMQVNDRHYWVAYWEFLDFVFLELDR